jgi:hypothetical protein
MQFSHKLSQQKKHTLLTHRLQVYLFHVKCNFNVDMLACNNKERTTFLYFQTSNNYNYNNYYYSLKELQSNVIISEGKKNKPNYKK